jgi:hypothetical protein
MDVIVRATGDGMTLDISRPSGPYSDSVFLYNVLFFDLDSPCSFLGGAAFETTSARINGLIPGHRYFVAMEVWNSAGAGFPAAFRTVVPGSGTPAPPQNLRIQAVNAVTVHMTWDTVSGAGGYIPWIRNANDGGNFEPLYSVDMPCTDVSFLFPGTWNYE